jgi:hypothetical protein
VVCFEKHTDKIIIVKRFIFKTAVVSALCATTGHVLPFFSDMANRPVWYLTIFTYAFLIILLRAWVVKSQKSSAIRFATAINGITLVKMFFTLIIVTSYLVAKLPFSKQFVFGVFALFIAFSVLFVIDAQRLIRKG